MARVDDYLGARKIAAETLSGQPFEAIAKRSGFETSGGNRFRVPFLNRVYEVGFPGFEFRDEASSEKEIPLQEQVLLLHYMLGETTTGRTEWIAYREIPGASFYFGPFTNRAINPLKQVFGGNLAGLKLAAGRLDGKPADTGDAGFDFQILPRTALRVILWEGDEEFEADAGILFQKNISELLLPEDAAWLGSLLAYRLIALSR